MSNKKARNLQKDMCLASQQGIEGEDVLIARGLPGKEAPESAGRLIAETVLKLCAEKES